MYPKLLGAAQAGDTGTSVQSGGSPAPVTMSRYAPSAPQPILIGRGTTLAQEREKIGYSEQWAPKYTPVLRAIDEEASTPPKAGDSGVFKFPGGPMITCVPGWTGPDCRTRIATPTQPEVPIAHPLPGDDLPADVQAYTGRMAYQTEAAEGGGVVEVRKGEPGAPGAFDFAKLLPLALIGLSFFRK